MSAVLEIRFTKPGAPDKTLFMHQWCPFWPEARLILALTWGTGTKKTSVVSAGNMPDTLRAKVKRSLSRGYRVESVVRGTVPPEYLSQLPDWGFLDSPAPVPRVGGTGGRTQ